MTTQKRTTMKFDEKKIGRLITSWEKQAKYLREYDSLPYLSSAIDLERCIKDLRACRVRPAVKKSFTTPKVRKAKKCKGCGGTGIDDMDSSMYCPVCNGGKVRKGRRK